MTAASNPWPAGSPCWLDIMVPDVDRTSSFYAGLLGWEVAEPEGDNGYRMATLDGAPVAGFSPTMPGADDAPVQWVPYLATDDLAATHAAAEERGARTIVAPMDIGESGRMGLWLDPSGAAFAAWEAGAMRGFGEFGVPGALTWTDLMTDDVDAAVDFYSALFPLTFSDMSDEMGMRYRFLAPAGGSSPMGGIGQARPDDTPNWSVCFAVADLDAALTRVPGLGGRVAEEPFTFPYGRMALVAGPDGEVVAIASDGDA